MQRRIVVLVVLLSVLLSACVPPPTHTMTAHVFEQLQADREIAIELRNLPQGEEAALAWWERVAGFARTSDPALFAVAEKARRLLETAYDAIAEYEAADEDNRMAARATAVSAAEQFQAAYAEFNETWQLTLIKHITVILDTTVPIE